MQDIMGCEDGEDVDMGWEATCGQLAPNPCQAYTGWCSHTSAYAEACIEAGMETHGWAFAGLFPGACGHSLQ